MFAAHYIVYHTYFSTRLRLLKWLLAADLGAEPHRHRAFTHPAMDERIGASLHGTGDLTRLNQNGRPL